MKSHNGIITRFAPSPTGYLHIGGARTALFNYLFARKYGGRFILRIEDTDTARNSQQASDAILTSLEWLGLLWDDGPYYQSRRIDIYHEYARRLIDENKAYRCFCSPKNAQAPENINHNGIDSTDKIKNGKDYKNDNRENNAHALANACPGRCSDISPDESAAREKNAEKFAVRFKIPAGRIISYNDMVHGRLEFKSELFEDFVIIKSDKMPAYNFAVSIDDLEMKVSHVIRGDDHISNTPKQLLIFDALKMQPPEYGHVPMILGPDRAKLSKRHGAVSLSYYEEAGFIKEAVVNYLALLGWAYDDKTEFFTIEELIKKFDENKFGRTPAIFDIKKLEHFNHEHLKITPIESKTKLIYKYVKNFMPEFNIDQRYDNIHYFEKVIAILGERIKSCRDIHDYAKFMFTDALTYPESIINKIRSEYDIDESIKALSAMNEIINKTFGGPSEEIEKNFRELKIAGLNFSKMIFLLRSAITAQNISPGIFETINVLTLPRASERIKKFIAILRN